MNVTCFSLTTITYFICPVQGRKNEDVSSNVYKFKTLFDTRTFAEKIKMKFETEIL